MCLLKGKVENFQKWDRGAQSNHSNDSSYPVFRLSRLFANEPYVTAASAFESSTVCLISMEIIEDILRKNGDLAMFFIQQLSIDLGIADQRVVNLTQKHIRGRLAESLLFLKESYGLEEDGATLNIYLAREDLANLSNMTTSNAIRTLSGLSMSELLRWTVEDKDYRRG